MRSIFPKTLVRTSTDSYARRERFGRLVSGSADRTVKLWNLETPAASLYRRHGGQFGQLMSQNSLGSKNTSSFSAEDHEVILWHAEG